MHLLFALDQRFESLAVVALTSYLLHHHFESVVLVTPADQRLFQLESVANSFGVPFEWQPIEYKASIYRLDRSIQPYFFCVEALQQLRAGRYLYVDADTLCVDELSSLEELPLDDAFPLAACSHGRPMPDRSLLLGLQSDYHYFNAGVLLFDSAALRKLITPAVVVEFYKQNRAICRFREQCALNGLLRGRVRFLPGQYNMLSWMRERHADGRWHNLSANPMAYCLPDVRERMAIAHFSAGAIPSNIPISNHEPVDSYWLYLRDGVSHQTTLPALMRFTKTNFV
tara:strand:+ start:101 stop:952 length:852 start_codon:yes stop_codon:yes gene_type:complete